MGNKLDLDVQEMVSVLLIDSHRITLWGLKHLIESSGSFSVCALATNQQEALKSIEKHSPDVIILEPDLDGENGIELIPLLLHHSNARVIVLTGLRDSASHDLAIVKGARGVLQKSDSHENLLKAIQKIHEGELWVNRDATSRILMQIAQANAPKMISPEQKKLATLSTKELKVSQSVHTYPEKNLKEIASTLHISEHTLRNHLASIYSKLGLRNRLELHVFWGRCEQDGNLPANTQAPHTSH